MVCGSHGSRGLSVVTLAARVRGLDIARVKDRSTMGRSVLGRPMKQKNVTHMNVQVDG